MPLLAALVDAGKPLTLLRDPGAGAGMTSAKAHPYLVSFIRVGLVQQDGATGQYELGPFALQMGLVSLQRLDRCASPCPRSPSCNPRSAIRWASPCWARTARP